MAIVDVHCKVVVTTRFRKFVPRVNQERIDELIQSTIVGINVLIKPVDILLSGGKAGRILLSGMMGKWGYIQVRLDITVGICCLLIWDCQHGLVREPGGNKGTSDFLVLTQKFRHVPEKCLKGSHIGPSKALTRRAQVLVLFACCGIGGKEEGSVELVPGHHGDIRSYR